MDKEGYKQWYCSKFPPTTEFATQDETIPNNATNVVWAKVEAFHTATIADHLLFAAAKRETQESILAFVEDTWFRKMREPTTFYTAMALSELLDQLQTLCGGLHDINVLALQNEMQIYHLGM